MNIVYLFVILIVNNTIFCTYSRNGYEASAGIANATICNINKSLTGMTAKISIYVSNKERNQYIYFDLNVSHYNMDDINSIEDGYTSEEIYTTSITKDSIEHSNGIVVINGKILSQPYAVFSPYSKNILQDVENSLHRISIDASIGASHKIVGNTPNTQNNKSEIYFNDYDSFYQNKNLLPIYRIKIHVFTGISQEEIKSIKPAHQDQISCRIISAGTPLRRKYPVEASSISLPQFYKVVYNTLFIGAGIEGVIKMQDLQFSFRYSIIIIPNIIKSQRSYKKMDLIFKDIRVLNTSENVNMVNIIDASAHTKEIGEQKEYIPVLHHSKMLLSTKMHYKCAKSLLLISFIGISLPFYKNVEINNYTEESSIKFFIGFNLCFS